MENKNYTSTIEVTQSPKEVFECIKDVSKWWNKECEGSTDKLNDEFIIRHGDVHYSKQKLVEVIPGKKVTWLVTDSELNWLENKTEWTNTKMVFEITFNDGKTIINFTHEGLIPEKECYAMVSASWDRVIKYWLFNFITTGKTI